MHSCAWINGQYQQVGPPSQSSQAATPRTCDARRNGQAVPANNLSQYRTSDTGVPPPPYRHFTFHNEHFGNKRKSNWQTSTVHHQSVSSQKPAGGNTNNNLLTVFNNNLHNPSSHTQSGNRGFNFATQQDFHQNYMGNGKQSIRAHNGNVSNVQQSLVQKSLLQNVNGDGELIIPPPAYTTTATSLPHEQVVCTSPLVSAQNRETAHNHNRRQYGIPPPGYYATGSQYFRNENITANSPSQQNLHSMSQTTQQYSTHNNGREATTSINPNSHPAIYPYSQQYKPSPFLPKTNDHPINPTAADTQQRNNHLMMIARIAEDLCGPFVATSDGRPPVYSSSPYSGKHLVNESNQNMQPVPTVAESYNSNASQSLPLNSGQCFSKTTHSVNPRTQHSLDVPPQQSSVPNVFYVTSTGDGIGSMAASALVPKRNLVGSLSDASQLRQLPETQSSVANTREITEKLSSVKSNDGSIHSSAGHIGPRAVAVVQPLSQKSYRVAKKSNSSNTSNQMGECTTTDESLNVLEKVSISPTVEKNKNAPCLREGSNIYPDNQMRSNTSSVTSNDGTFVSSSTEDLSAKTCADDTGSEVAINMPVDQRVAPTAQQSVTSEVPVSQPGDKDKGENPTDPEAWEVELSSVLTVPWTAATLAKLLSNAEKRFLSLRRNVTEVSAGKIINMFWDGRYNDLVCKLRTGWYNTLITDVREFCSKHVTPDSVILSQVKYGVEKQLKIFHVLKDNEVYSELPYKSSWLNVNEQLDDIDKEFGFQWSLKHRLHVLESRSQPDQVETGNSIPAQSVNEVSNRVLSQTKLQPVDSGDEKQASPVKTTSTPTQTVIPNETVSVHSSDPYSFQINVLPPEEAKAIFEQVQNTMSQSMDTERQLERVANSSVESELPEVRDVAMSESKPVKKSVWPIDQICCIDRWIDIILGSSNSKCLCKNEQSNKDFTDKTLDEEDMTVQKKEKPCAIRSESIGENEVKGVENINNQIMTFSQTIDLTQDNKPHSYSDKEPKIIYQINLNSSQSSIILISESEDEDLFSSENEIPNQMTDFEKDSEQGPIKLTESVQSSGSDSREKETKQFSRSDTEIQSDPEVDYLQDPLKSTRTLSCTSVRSDNETEKLSSGETEVASQLSDLEENCGKARLTSTNVPKPSLETEEQQTQISVTAAPQTTCIISGDCQTVERKQKRLCSHDDFLYRKKSKKPPVDVDSQPRKAFVDGTDEPLASNVRTVELVLFGSAAQDECALISSRKRSFSSPEAVSDGPSRPPKVLSVNLSPLRRRSIEAALTGDYSVKRRIRGKLRGFSPTTFRQRKPKPQTCTFASLSGVNLKKTTMVGPTNTVELPVSSEMRTWNQKSKHCLRLKRRWSLSNGLKRGGEKNKKYVVSLKQPADQVRSNAENGSHAVMPLQEENVLRFSVLPNTFNFKDGSNGRKESSDPVADNPDFVEGKDESYTKTVIRARGTWCPNPAKKYSPLIPPPVPKTSVLFYEFKKKYMEMTKPSMDE